MESEQAKVTIEHVRNTPEVEEEDTKIVEEAKARHLSSSSSVSSSSSSHAPLEHDSISKSKSEGDLQHGQGSNISMPNCPSQTPEWGMLSASPPVGLGGHLSPTTSPPVQTMGHPSSYDPDRIPASVFASKPANASEWSMASNDSLFSIHVGNNSFAIDQFRSGELVRLDELNNAQSLYVSEAKSNELCSLPTSLPPLLEVPANEEDSVRSSNTTPKAMRGATTPRLSNESGHSSISFALPALDNEGGKGSSLERIEEKPEVQTQDSNSTDTPKSTTGRWFSWCSCLPRCC